ncbi:MAG: FHA domain-containing protein [Myxococcales bacterium]|nr:FHA domain-containing protein [Myxococcales bacterium]
MATVVIRHPDGSLEEREIAAEATIGRSDGNDIVLAEGGVSRRHARLFVEGGKLLVEDAGSSNGTFVDGERIARPTPLGPRTQLVIGDYEIQVKGGSLRGSAGPVPKNGAKGLPGSSERTTAQKAIVKAAKATRTIPAVANPKPAVRQKPQASPKPGAGHSLKGLTGPWLNKVFTLRGTSTIGRVPGVEIQLEDDSVSRRHAEIEVTPKGVVLRDLGSANGTFVNWQQIESETFLQSGDQVKFGVIEMMFESAMSLLPARRGLPGGAVAEGGGGRASVFRRKSVIIAGASVGLLLVVGVLAKVFSGPPKVLPGRGQPIVEVDPLSKLGDLLSECRSYSSVELGNPDWGRAEAACNRALDLDPIHPEANQLIRKIRIEKECADAFTRGTKAMQRLREEEALELFGKITPDCSYYLKVKPVVKEAIDQVMKNSGDDCKRYVSHSHWQSALPRCELYMKFACQNMTTDQLHPPPGYELVTSSGRLKRGQWRPKDPMYLNFLRARERADPGAPTWQCPPMKIMRREESAPDPKADLRKHLEKRFEEKDLAKAMELYFDGRANDAIYLLQRLREKQEKASYHALADELRKDITSVDQLFKEGQSALQAEQPDRAAEPFTEALELDEKLLQEQATKSLSHYRRTIQQDMAAAAYLKGKGLADRLDYRAACKIWKLGFGFFKGNPELLRALGNVCTHMAGLELEKATSCETLPKVLDFAVEGDGVTEKVAARKAEWQCP